MFQVYDMRTLREIRLIQPDVKAILHGSWRDGGFFHAGDLLDWFDAKRGM